MSEPRQAPATGPPRLVYSLAWGHNSAMLSRNLILTLQGAASFLAIAKDPWWVLGSAAVALKGYDAGEVGDVDILVSEADASRLMARHGLKNKQDGGTALFRSSFFLLPELGPVRVEAMAGYEICERGTWAPVWPSSREIIHLCKAGLFVPSDQNLIDIFKRLGRDKDRLRINAMQAR